MTDVNDSNLTQRVTELEHALKELTQFNGDVLRVFKSISTELDLALRTITLMSDELDSLHAQSEAARKCYKALIEMSKILAIHTGVCIKFDDGSEGNAVAKYLKHVSKPSLDISESEAEGTPPCPFKVGDRVRHLFIGCEGEVTKIRPLTEWSTSDMIVNWDAGREGTVRGEIGTVSANCELIPA